MIVKKNKFTFEKLKKKSYVKFERKKCKITEWRL